MNRLKPITHLDKMNIIEDSALEAAIIECTRQNFLYNDTNLLSEW